MASIVFWWLLLWGSYRLAALYGGPSAGRLALALVACEPILLGHAGLATTDVPFTACFVTFLAVFRARREKPHWRGRLVLPIIWCTLTFLAKASALVFVPVGVALIELERLWQLGWRPGRSDGRFKASFKDLVTIGVAGILLLLVVCPRAPRGLLFQIRHNVHEHGTSYLLGRLSADGFLYYFPAALAIKLGLPVLLLFLGMLLARPRHWLNGPMWAALGLLALTPLFRVQIGVRFVLPLAVLAIVGAAAACARWWAETEVAWRRCAIQGCAALLVGWSIINAWQVWPNGICYTNELWGGTSQGYVALDDSNYDWGQGLGELAAWQQHHPGTPLHIWYCGTDPMLARMPVTPIAIAAFSSEEDVVRQNHGCFLAVTTNYCACDCPLTSYLRRQQPADRTSTFLIYDFTGKMGPD
jgi:hypothetical protein